MIMLRSSVNFHSQILKRSHNSISHFFQHYCGKCEAINQACITSVCTCWFNYDLCHLVYKVTNTLDLAILLMFSLCIIKVQFAICLCNFRCNFLLLIDVNEWTSCECSVRVHILRTFITYILVDMHQKTKIAKLEIAAKIVSVNGLYKVHPLLVQCYYRKWRKRS
jgi:hypothetical protein